MSNAALTALLGLTALLSVTALVLGVLAARAAGLLSRRTESLPADHDPAMVGALRREVEKLRERSDGALRRLAVVRYDAFGDMGGRLSWSLALADDDGNGVVLTSIHGRSDARAYAKSLKEWSAEQPLSPEEEESVRTARGGGR